jgi:hypothetical protein
MNKNYEQKPLGFDRTQLFKEYTQPITNRQSALKAALTLMTSNNLSWSMKDIMLVTERIQNWMETGDDSFVPKMDKYFKLKSDQQLEELFTYFLQNQKNFHL